MIDRYFWIFQFSRTMKILLLLSLSFAIGGHSSSPWNKDSCLPEEGRFYSDNEIASAPSSAPSESIDCKEQTSNARGRYTSSVSPCVFNFHKLDPLQQELENIKFRTSDLCSSENSFLSVIEYVDEWADECVGDFQRCYSLEHHQSIIFDFLCSKDWQVPKGTTHVSVDCTKDKILVNESYNHKKEEHIRQEHQARLETYENELFHLFIWLSVCLIGVCAVSTWIVKPLVVASKTRCTNYHVLPRSRSCNCDTCQQLGEQEGEEEHDDENHDDDNDREDLENFEMQVPADFDAIPIVNATIL